MRNKAMERKLDRGDVIDVRQILVKAETSLDGKATLYWLTEYLDDVDYCDAETEQWIWSIGQSLIDGTIVASTDGRYYQNPDFHCLWLR